MRSKFVVIGGVVLVALGAGSSLATRTISDKANHDQTVAVANNDAAMQQAFAKARQSLPQFFDMLAHPDLGARDFAVKVGMKVPHGFEFIWLSAPKLADDQIVGVVANTPRDSHEISAGQTITVPRAMIVDWTYRYFDATVGNYSACALLSHASAAERQAFLETYKLSCET